MSCAAVEVKHNEHKDIAGLLLSVNVCKASKRRTLCLKKP